MKELSKVFVVPYFGALPNYFQLWLKSCSLNNDFKWLLITDSSLEEVNIPNNVIIKKSSLKEVSNIFSEGVGDSVLLKHPYKLCDFRPLYWMLLDYYKIEYDFWGYCDVDLLFGRLNVFFDQGIFNKYDKVGSFGHFTLVRADDRCKNAYKMSGAKYSWKTVLFSDKTFGFDERFGLNSIWSHQKFNVYDTENYLLDILPDYKNFFLVNIPQNRKKQILIYSHGKILQWYGQRKMFKEKEFAYIHFQKRKMNINFTYVNQQQIILTPDGFFEIPDGMDECLKLVRTFPSAGENLSVKLRKMRTAFRYYKNKVLKSI